MTAREKQARLRRFADLCRQRGLALTAQRRIILEAVLGRTDHPSAEALFDAVRPRLPDVSRTTVYRVLELLVQVDAIRKVSSPSARARYDPMIEPHHHLVCSGCERLIDLEDEHVNYAVGLPDVRVHAFEIQGFSISFYGICAVCARKRSRAAAAKSESRTARRRRTSDQRKRRTTK